MSAIETHRQALGRVEQAIVRGYRMGMCDSDGHSITRSDGTFTAKPRAIAEAAVKFRKVYPREP